jgi:hypothetical protein
MTRAADCGTAASTKSRGVALNRPRVSRGIESAAHSGNPLAPAAALIALKPQRLPHGA